MTPSARVLVVIPARGGSKGIPRKNLRSLNGRPLLAYSIETALRSRYHPDVYVSSDDAEILAMAGRLGARVHRRDPALAADVTTLDPVICAAWAAIKAETGGSYDVVVTLQPTSPLLRTASLDAAIERLLASPELDTLISATDATHLTWREEGGRFVKNYEQRVNRQQLPRTYRETGGLLLAREATLATGTRVGATVSVFPLAGGEAIDIDGYDDWSLCEYYLSHKRLLFVVTGNHETGLGHVYNALALAHDILAHRVAFLVDADSDLAFEKIAGLHFEVHRQQSADLVDDIVRLAPDVVVNDRLDTSAAYVAALKQAGFTVVGFEDLGPGAALADLVVNAIYPETRVFPNHYHGARYFCARDEFLLAPTKAVGDEVRRVLVTFGGVDPNNYTRKVLEAIAEPCRQRGVAIDVVTGFGYRAHATLADFPEVTVHRNVASLSELMARADVVLTSAGRTTYEIACIGTPALVLAQNERETTHFFATEPYGFTYLGLGTERSVPEIRAAFLGLVDDPSLRREMSRRMLGHDIRGGRARVVRLLTDLLRDLGGSP